MFNPSEGINKNKFVCNWAVTSILEKKLKIFLVLISWPRKKVNWLLAKKRGKIFFPFLMFSYFCHFEIRECFLSKTLKYVFHVSYEPLMLSGVSPPPLYHIDYYYLQNRCKAPAGGLQRGFTPDNISSPYGIDFLV